MDIGIIISAILLGKFLFWTNINIAIFAFSVWVILNPISSRLLAVPALAFLSATPLVLVIFHNKEQADRFAIYAYYFLVMTVAMGIYELRKDAQKNSSNRN